MTALWAKPLLLALDVLVAIFNPDGVDASLWGRFRRERLETRRAWGAYLLEAKRS